VVADETLEEGVEAVEMEVAAIYAEIESLNSQMTDLKTTAAL
jgi:purine-nucleoside phosphorylase